MSFLDEIEDGAEVVRGLKFFKRPGYLAAELHYAANPEHRSAAWKDHARVGMGRALWDREMEIKWDATSGSRVYPMWDDSVHVRPIKPEIDWTRYRGMDHGVRAPTVCLWFAVTPPRAPWHTSDIYGYREYYKRNRTISQNCLAIVAMQPPGEPEPLRTYIDPAVGRRDDVTGLSLRDEYRRNGVVAIPADNSKDAGREVVRAYLVSAIARQSLATGRVHHFLEGASRPQLMAMASHPAVYFDPCMVETAKEMSSIRFKDRKTQKDLNPKEEEEDKDDHSVDAARYVLVSRPKWIPVEQPEQAETFGARAIRLIQEAAEHRGNRDVFVLT